ncbi:MAG: UDP-N-acetylmuramoyl-L-alanyl-D-glutamate--2,6-diaminopimelate ligase [Desulfovibrio sp.]|nr:MAG: UDP-N-acetylmuramoyl-L-alanyl-D-glutamate--2,6-diaminopimelate ligase [Desulfovibrio sp.]
MSMYDELKDQARQGLDIRTHSGKVAGGDVFVAIPGSRVDGRDFIPDALERGAAWVVTNEPFSLPEASAARIVIHEDPREALGELAAARYGSENLDFPLVGVTGTNGKTTIVHTLEHLYTANNKRAGLIGTVAQRWPGHDEEASMTTPDCIQLHESFGEMARAGVDAAFMEVSSHALDQHRTAGLEFSVAALSNMSQDHLDYHGDMESYFAAKARLFTGHPKQDKMAVINVDDAQGKLLVGQGVNAIAYGLTDSGASMPGTARYLHGQILADTVAGLRLSMTFAGRSWELRSPMIGQHNAQNLLTVQGVGLALGLEPEAFSVLENYAGVPGRLERVSPPGNFHVFVDYAHTPDALENVLAALKQLDFKRLITVFGCGGDRDRTKRPLMAQAVAKYSDVAVLTSDNPRSEDPVAIMNDARPGLLNCKQVFETPDRRQAIGVAISEMAPGDVVLIAGKGHEPYQEVKGVKHPFSDQEVAREILA